MYIVQIWYVRYVMQNVAGFTEIGNTVLFTSWEVISRTRAI